MNGKHRKNNFKIEMMDQHGNKKNCMSMFNGLSVRKTVWRSQIAFVTAQEFNILNLIQEVKKHPILYAKDIKASKESREEAWQKISRELVTPRKFYFDLFSIRKRLFLNSLHPLSSV